MVLAGEIVKVLPVREIDRSMPLLASGEGLAEIGEYVTDYTAVADELNYDPTQVRAPTKSLRELESVLTDRLRNRQSENALTVRKHRQAGTHRMNMKP